MSPVELSKDYVDTIGNLLKSTREKRAENLPEIAFRIALSPTQLRAIEAGDLRPFYSARYFLQAANRYAEFLGITLPSHSAAPLTPEAAPTATTEEFASTGTTSEHQDFNEASLDHSEPVVAPINITAAPQDAPTQPPEPKPKTRAVEPQDPDSDSGILGEPSEPVPSTRSSFRLSWGWVAFGCAVLIALGVTKISLTPSTPAPTISASAQAPTEPDAKEPGPQPTAQPTASAGPGSPAVTPAVQSQDKKAAATPIAAASAPGGEKRITPSTPIDSQLLTQASTWVQIVKANGEKVNIKAEPGQPVDFHSESTAAVVFGQPEKASLRIKGKPVNITPFVTSDNPPRALVILNQIKE